jgi:hypothetical protein
MEIPLSELIDKASIIKIKIEKASDKKMIMELKKELQEYQNSINVFSKRGVKVDDSWFTRLYEINKGQWELESEMNKARNNGPQLSQMGRLYIKLQQSNKKRVAVKNEIAEKTGIGYKDIKIN